MKRNESGLDRVVRAVAGLALLAGALATSGALKIALLVLAAIALVTAFTGFCLLYRLFGFSTLSERK